MIIFLQAFSLEGMCSGFSMVTWMSAWQFLQQTKGMTSGGEQNTILLLNFPYFVPFMSFSTILNVYHTRAGQ